jgi:hypothetical protein
MTLLLFREDMRSCELLLCDGSRVAGSGRLLRLLWGLRVSFVPFLLDRRGRGWLGWMVLVCGGSGVLALVLVEVAGGELEGVEEEAGAAEVDVVAGDAEHDVSDGLLDLVAGLRGRDREGGLAGSALAESGDGAAGLVVVVAEALAAHGGAAAAAAIDDVAAAERRGSGLLGYMDGVGHAGGGVGHGGPSPGMFLCKIFET